MQPGNKFPRIALDRRSVRWREGTGIARYREGLAAAAARIGTPVPVGDGGEERRLDLRVLQGRVSGWCVPDLFRLAQKRFTLTGRVLEVVVPDPPPIAHWSHPMPIRIAGAANLYTVHDLIPLEAPELSAIPPRRFARLLKAIGEGVAQFVTVSETVRAGLAARGFDATCCYQAVEPGVPGVLPAGIEPGYFLVLGRVEARKNVERIVAAWRASGTRRQLVIAGPDAKSPSRMPEGQTRIDVRPIPPSERSSGGGGPRPQGVVEGVTRHRERVSPSTTAFGGGPPPPLFERGRNGRGEFLPGGGMRAVSAIRLGWTDDATTAALLANAYALLMPSLAEGFGLPAIEAMHFGVPAMTSDRGAAAEIAGAAALQVDPTDTDAIARGIARLDADEPLRAQLVARGGTRAVAFGIESFAERLARLYEQFA